MGAESEDGAAKGKHQENPFIEPAQHQTVVDMKGKTHLKKIILLIFIILILY